MKEPLVLGIAVVGIGLLCGVAAWFGYGARAETVGLYSCSSNLSSCTRLVWTNSLIGCRTARARYSDVDAPTVGGVLACVRLSDFVTD